MSDSFKNPRSVIFAEEAFVVDVQSFLHRVMEEKNINRTQLAAAMGVSKARISQIFSDECKNFTIRLLARACHALGEEPRISSGMCDMLDLTEKLEEQAETISVSKNILRLKTWAMDEDESSSPQCFDKARKYSRTLANRWDGSGKEARMAVN